MKVVLSLLLGLFAVQALYANLAYYNIKDFGARNDDHSINTIAIQKTIDTCYNQGGGTVYFPPGQYISGTIVLKSNVTLFLDKGAILLGSTNLEDYPSKIAEFRSYTDNYTCRSLIYSEKQENISIIGEGVIDGQGGLFPFGSKENRQFMKRPYLIRIIQCKKIRVKDISLRNSAMWMQHYLGCDYVQIDGITIHNWVNGNNDGIDIDCSQNVTISNCIIDCDDDCICIKSTSNRKSKNVTVTNCVLRTRCGGIDLGTESNGGFENILYNNIVIRKAREGISLKLVDGGEFNKVTVTNVIMDSVINPIFIRLANRARPFHAKHTDNSKDVSFEIEKNITPIGIGSMKNILISNITATNAGDCGCYILGLKDHYVENVTLNNIYIQVPGGGKESWAQRIVPENPTKYPQSNNFDGPAPAYGFYVRHIKNMFISHIQLDYKDSEFRPALMFEDVDGLRLSSIQAMMPVDSCKTIIYKDVIKLIEN